jgi:hypothetical protein
VRRAGYRDLALFHRLEQGRLHLGRCPVDLVSQDEVAKDRPGLKAEAPLAPLVIVDLRSGDV